MMSNKVFAGTYYLAFGSITIGLLLGSLLSPLTSRWVDVTATGPDGLSTTTRYEMVVYGIMVAIDQPPPPEAKPLPDTGDDGNVEVSSSSSSGSELSDSVSTSSDSLLHFSSSSRPVDGMLSEPISSTSSRMTLPHYTLYSIFPKPHLLEPAFMKRSSHTNDFGMKATATEAGSTPEFAPSSNRRAASVHKLADATVARVGQQSREAAGQQLHYHQVLRIRPRRQLLSQPFRKDGTRRETLRQGRRALISDEATAKNQLTDDATACREGTRLVPPCGSAVAKLHIMPPTDFRRDDFQNVFDSMSVGDSSSSSSSSDSGKPSGGIPRSVYSLRDNPYPALRRCCIAYLVMLSLGTLLSSVLVVLALVQTLPFFAHWAYGMNTLRGLFAAIVLVTVACMGTAAAMAIQSGFYGPIYDAFFLTQSLRRQPGSRARSGLSCTVAAAVIGVIALIGLGSIKAD